MGVEFSCVGEVLGRRRGFHTCGRCSSCVQSMGSFGRFDRANLEFRKGVLCVELILNDEHLQYTILQVGDRYISRKRVQKLYNKVLTIGLVQYAML